MILSDCRLELLPVLLTLLWVWKAHRAKNAELARLNAAGGICKHGRSKFKLCRDCAVDFARKDGCVCAAKQLEKECICEAAQEKGGSDATGDKPAAPPAPVVAGGAGWGGVGTVGVGALAGAAAGGIAAAMAAGFGSLTASGPNRINAEGEWMEEPRGKRPLRLDIPPAYQREISYAYLEVSTNASWKGPLEIAVVSDYGIHTQGFQHDVPASVCNWRFDLQRRQGMRSVILSDRNGIDRIKLMIQGNCVVDVDPKFLDVLNRQSG